MFRARRSGFTLLELLAVIGVIGILLALALPAVQQAREAARRTECRSRLRQLAIGLHNYHDAHRTLPPGDWMDQAGDVTVQNGQYVVSSSYQGGWGWGAMLLPHLDQAPLHARLDFNRGTCDGTNRAAVAISVPLWACPSDSAPSTCVVGLGGGSVEVATGNYCGVDQMLSALGPVRFGQVADGLSQTLMVGERRFLPATADSNNLYTSPWCGFLLTETDLVWNAIPHLGTWRDYGINRPANAPAVFSSRHTGGAHFALGDGAVRFFSDSTDSLVLEAMGTIAGGETINLD